MTHDQTWLHERTTDLREPPQTGIEPTTMEDCTLSENILSFFYWGTTRINQLKLEQVGLGSRWIDTHSHTP